MKSIINLLGIFCLTLFLQACGSGGGGNLFDQSFSAQDGQAALNLNRSKVTGIWESRDRADFHSRIKVENNKLTFAAKCVEDDIVVQASTDIELDKSNQTFTITEELSKSETKDGIRCWFRLPEGSRSYVITDTGLVIQGFDSAFGTYFKLSEL